MVDKIKSWWQNGISIDETKSSILILVFLLASIGSMIAYGFNGDITDNCLDFLKIMVFSIAGVNGITTISNAVKGFNEMKNK